MIEKEKISEKTELEKENELKELKELQANTKQTVKNTKGAKNLEKNFLGYRKYILYFTSKTKLNGNLIGIPNRATKGFTLRLNKNESFYLAEESFNLFGRGVWICIRGIPYSVPLECRDLREYCKELGVIEKELKKLPAKSFRVIDIGYSTTDMDSMNYSQVVTATFRKNRFNLDFTIRILLLLLSVVSIEYIVLSTIWSV